MVLDILVYLLTYLFHGVKSVVRS